MLLKSSAKEKLDSEALENAYEHINETVFNDKSILTLKEISDE